MFLKKCYIVKFILDTDLPIWPIKRKIFFPLRSEVCFLEPHIIIELNLIVIFL